MWYSNTTSITIVIGAPGMIKKNTDKPIKKIPGNSSEISLVEDMPTL